MAKQNPRILPPSETPVHVRCGSLLIPAVKKDFVMDHGTMLSSIVRACGLQKYEPRAVVTILGEPIPREWWDKVRVKGGTTVNVGIAPAGDPAAGAKFDQRRVAALLTVATGALLPGAIGLSGMYAYLATAAIDIVGLLALDRLFPVTPQTEPTTLFSLEGPSRNRSNPYGPMPLMYGKRRVYPMLGAAPFSHSDSERQYWYAIFVVGVGAHYIDPTTMKFGETPLTDFDGVNYRIHSGLSERDAQFDYYPQDIYEEQMNERLHFTGSFTESENVTTDDGTTSINTDVEKPEVVHRTSATNAIGLSVDILFPDGLYVSGSDQLGAAVVDINVQFRRVGGAEDGWIDVPPRAKNDLGEPINYMGDIIDGSTEYGISQAALFEDISTLRTTGTHGLAALVTSIDAISGSTYIRNGSIRDAISANATALIDMIAELDTTDYSGETPGWRASVITNLDTTLDDIVTSMASVEVTSNQNIYSVTLENFVAKLAADIDMAMYIVNVLLAYQQTRNEAPENFWRNSAFNEYLGARASLTNIYGDTPLRSWRFRGSKAGAIRRTIGPWAVPQGQYEVRVRRANYDAPTEDKNVYDDAYLAVVRTHQAGLSLYARNATSELWEDWQQSDLPTLPVNPSVCFIEMQLEANESLSGSLDQFNVIAERMLPYYTGSSWLYPSASHGGARQQAHRDAGRNPAWILADILCGEQNANPLNRSTDLDIQSFVDFADDCTFDTDANGDIVPKTGCYFDYWLDGDMTVEELASKAAAVGYGTITKTNNLVGVVVDKARTTPTQLFTPRNSSGFKFSHSLAQPPNALKVRFINSDAGYVEDEWMVYNDDYSEDNEPDYGTIETVTLDGVTDAPPDTDGHNGQAWRYGRYILAATLLRLEEYKLDVDFEYLTANRGDLVEVQYDLTLWGLGSARITSITRNGSNHITAIGIDELVALPSGSTYAFRCRDATGTLHTAQVVHNSNVETAGLTLSSAYDDSSAMAVGDLISYGVRNGDGTDLVTTECIIKEIIPKNDLTAELTLVSYNEAIYTSADNEIPAWDSRITRRVPPDALLPDPPTFESVVTDESALTRNPDGSLVAGIQVVLQPPRTEGGLGNERNQREVTHIELQYQRELTGDRLTEIGTNRYPETSYADSGNPTWVRAAMLPVDNLAYLITPTIEGASYNLRARSVTRDGRAGLWKLYTGIVVIGRSTPPPDVLSVSVQGDGNRIVWDYNESLVPDLKGYMLKLDIGNSGWSWSKAIPMVREPIRNRSFDLTNFNGGTYGILVKAVDVAGNESVNYAKVVIDRSARDPNYVIEQDEVSLGFPGIITNGSILSGGSLAADADSAAMFWGDDVETFWGSDGGTFWQSTTYKELVYRTTVDVDAADLPGKFTVNATITGEYKIEVRVGDTWELWKDTTLANAGKRIWPDDLREDFWPQSFAMREYAFSMDASEGITEVRVTVKGGATQGTISALTLTVDVPDIEERFEDYDLASGGEQVTLTKTFRAIKQVLAQINYSATYPNAARVIVTDKSDPTGPYLRAYQSGGTDTGAIVDILVRGY